MSEGHRLLSSIITNQSAGTLLRLDRQMLEGDEVDAFNFMLSHYRAHRVLPQAQTVTSETGVRIPTVNEPLEFYLNNVHDRHDYNRVREHWGTLREQLSTGNDMAAVRATIAQMARDTRSARRDNRVVTMGEAVQLSQQRLIETMGMGGITGIETGWASFDEMTGGYQDADLITWVARPSIGKCMHPDTPVIMHSGQVRAIKTVKVGDTLMGPDSKPRTILSTTTGREEMFRITPVRGESWICNRSHILVLRCNYNLDKKHTKGSTHLYSVDQYLSLPSRVQRKLRLLRTGVDFPRKEVEVSPYFTGLWLGDGTVDYPRVSTIDIEIANAIIDEAQRFGMAVRQYENREGACPQYGVVNVAGKENIVLDHVRNCYRNGEKRIPETYLRNDRETRLEMLAGIIDTDGWLHTDGILYEVCTKYPGLRDDILYLARSVGLCADYAVKTVNGAEYQRITITGAIYDVPCRLPRKQAVKRQVKTDALTSGFSLESVGEGEYFGITLDSDHLYLLGDFTVTHNTYALLKQARHANRVQGKSVLFVTTEMGLEQIARRDIALELGLRPDYLKNNTISTYSMRRIAAYRTELMTDDTFRIFSVGMGTQVSAIEALIDEFGPDIIYIDGGYLLHPSVKGKMNRIERVGEVFDELKGLTIACNRPIIVTMQYNRQAGKGGKDGSLENIGFTDAVGMHSSIVLGLNFGNDDTPRQWRIINFLKGREGEDGQIGFNFKFAPLDFSERPIEVEEAAANDDSDQAIWTA